MTMGLPFCSPRGCHPCPWDRPDPSQKEHQSSLKVMIRPDFTCNKFVDAVLAQCTKLSTALRAARMYIMSEIERASERVAGP